MQEDPRLDWNDLRIFLALVHHGSTVAAARALGVDQSTVHRHLAELERVLGGRLVQRDATGYRLTELGRGLVPHAERVEDAVRAFGRGVEALRRADGGVVRMTCPEPIVPRLTHSGFFDRFQARHPNVTLELITSDRPVDLTNGEADVALRSGDVDDDRLVGRKLAESVWAVYASRGYVERHGAPERLEDLAGHALIGFDAPMAGHRAARWLSDVAPDARLVARISSVLGLVAAARTGIGVAPLPTALGDAEPDLVRVLGPVPALARAWRLLTTPELRSTPRVAALFAFVEDELDVLRPILGG